MKVIIYDFDGVLVNSVNAIIHYYGRFFEHLNIAPPDWRADSVLSRVRGMSFDQFTEAFVPLAYREQFSAYSPSFTFEEMAAATPLEPETAETAALLSQKYSLAICTNRNTPIDDILNYHGIGRYFSFIITRADAEPKPSPDGLNKILDKFGQTSAVYIGDSAVDYEAAQNAGIDFIGYKTNIEGVNSISKHSEIFKFLSRQRLPF